MPFLTTDPMLECAHLVALRKDGLYSVSELAERSHARHTQEHQTPPETEALIVEARRAHPTWGPRKLLPYLARRHPGTHLPAFSTAGAMLKRHGLTKPRRKRRTPKHPGSAPLIVSAPNQIWTTDFKGQFKTRDGIYCYPLTVQDAHSRFVLGVKALPSVKQRGTFPVSERLFGDYGLPEAIRSDSGVPFATQAH